MTATRREAVFWELRSLALLALTLVSASAAFAQSWTQQAKLTASDGAAGDLFGYRVALSGNTIVVGSRNDADAGADTGSVHVYARFGTAWVQQQKLLASDAASLDYFGSSLAIDGDTIVAGAYGNDDVGTDSGSAYVFVRTGGTWTQQAKLTASDAGSGDYFGFSASISGDTAIIGAPRDNPVGSASGSAYVFTRAGGIWTQQQKLAASDAAATDQFGSAVSVSGDTAAVGAEFDDDAGTSSGSAYVFVRTGSIWTEQQKLTASDSAAGDQFGHSLGIADDAVVIGAVFDDGVGDASGSAYVFRRSTSVWSQEVKLTPSDAAAGDAFGISVAIEQDRVTVASIFADFAGDNSGAGYVFSRVGAGWIEEARLASTELALGDRLGSSISIRGDTIVAGAREDDDAGTDSGSAYVFQRHASRSAAEWTLLP